MRSAGAELPPPLRNGQRARCAAFGGASRGGSGRLGALSGMLGSLRAAVSMFVMGSNAGAARREARHEARGRQEAQERHLLRRGWLAFV